MALVMITYCRSSQRSRPNILNQLAETTNTIRFALAAASKASSVLSQMFTGIVLLGLWHGLVALPVILSLIGTAPYHSLAKSDYADNGVLNAPAGSNNDKDPVKEVAMQAPMVPTIAGNGHANGVH